MASLKENFQCWNESYDWKTRGDEWSEPWGTPYQQWLVTIWPRVSRFLPTGVILEIGSGYGRWSEYLRQHCDRLILVDLAPRCIEACKGRFAGEKKIQCFVNDGLTLSAIQENSVDFLFSFDSLVHADPDVLQSYMREAAAKLTRNGAGFIHHSNLGAYRDSLPSKPAENEYCRSRTMSAQQFREYCRKAGLCCVQQELVQWLQADCLLDCFSTFAKAASTMAEGEVSNRDFMAEAALARTLHHAG